MIDLRNITLININGVDPDIGVKALNYSSREIQFGAKKLVSFMKPPNITDDIEFIQSEKFTRESIETFHFDELHKIIDTEFVLSIQPDGFVINPSRWTDDFLYFDYVGSPWPHLPFCPYNRVGNGGFVLISKKLLEILPTLTNRSRNNDVVVSNVYYHHLSNLGIAFAPVTLAARFGLEMPIEEVEYNLDNCFGFHGLHTDQSKQYVDMLKNT